ncbi:hypothetical protein PL866_004350 [Salmonella enterica]|nr:hypothetical protein [Salmonella enterica]
MKLYEMEGFLRGKCIPGDLKVNETNAEYLVRKFSEAEAKISALAAENAYLLNGAARELNTSWMFHKTMLGAQAALVCLSHGYQAAAREWLEGTTDEAGAEIPDDISVGELHEWFDRQMVSNDGKSGFLTRSEAEEAIRKACPATDAFLAEVRAQGVERYAAQLKSEAELADETGWDGAAKFLISESEKVLAFAAQFRQEEAK